jgi:hypothetical protein
MEPRGFEVQIELFEELDDVWSEDLVLECQNAFLHGSNWDF